MAGKIRYIRLGSHYILAFIMHGQLYTSTYMKIYPEDKMVDWQGSINYLFLKKFSG